MNFLVDSNTILDFFNGKTELFHFFDNTENIYVSVVTIGALHYKAHNIESKKNVAEIADDFCSFLHVVNIDERIALKFGELKILYPDFNENKLWLCAAAVCNDFVLVSNDSDYEKIREVVVKKTYTQKGSEECWE